MNLDSCPCGLNRIAHRWHTVANPVSPATLTRAIASLGDLTGTRALDVGCGKGYLLVLLARAGASVTGYDRCQSELETARKRLVRAGQAAALLHTDRPPPGLWDVVTAIGSADALSTGTVAEALASASKLLPIGGRLVFADGYWREPPTQAIIHLAGDARRMTSLPTLLSSARRSGIRLDHVILSSTADWDRYIELYCRSLLNGQAAIDDDDVLRRRVAARVLKHEYRAWARTRLGFATVIGVREEG